MDSTFLQGLGVVVACVAGALWIALDTEDKGATSRRPRRTGGAPPTRAEREPVRMAAPAQSPAESAHLGPDAGAVTVAIGVAAPPATLGARLRSGLVLLVVLTMLGVVLALTLGSVAVVTALAVRGAVS